MQRNRTESQKARANGGQMTEELMRPPDARRKAAGTPTQRRDRSEGTEDPEHRTPSAAGGEARKAQQ